MFEKQIRTEIEIEASAEKVWPLLTEFGGVLKNERGVGEFTSRTVLPWEVFQPSSACRVAYRVCLVGALACDADELSCWAGDRVSLHAG
jgi:hypothetical protein